VCEKVFKERRKIFDSKRQRKYESKDIEEFSRPKTLERKNTMSKSIPITVTQAKPGKKQAKALFPSNKNAKWKYQSESLRAAMRDARGENNAVFGGGNFSSNQDYSLSADDRV